MTNNKEQFKRYIALVDRHLEEYFPTEENLQKTIFNAMHYSLFAGGKRIRPIICLGFAAMCGANEEDILPYACALEMIHTYSLIHDDLPCMDNDDFRRGKPTNHKVFGEATAVLAGDGLLNRAFEILIQAMGNGKIPLVQTVEAVKLLAQSSGADGMIGGQIIDMESEDKQISLEELIKLQSLKTGALFVASACIGCILAGASRQKIEAAYRYASCLGLAFQIQDDILDIVGDTKLLGKSTGKDVAQGKSTFVSAIGLEAAKEKVDALTQEAINALKVFDQNEFMTYIAQLMGGRNN
jgi:geranylgeranyl diphosphate synthase type II